MSDESFTDEQVDKARHALGLSRKPVAYRNYYVTPPDADWDNLVERGFAIRRPGGLGCCAGDVIYHLTKRGAFCFLNDGERIDPETRFPTPTTPERGR